MEVIVIDSKPYTLDDLLQQLREKFDPETWPEIEQLERAEEGLRTLWHAAFAPDA